jgi:hypothetical protein
MIGRGWRDIILQTLGPAGEKEHAEP